MKPLQTPITMLKTIDRDGYDLKAQPAPFMRVYSETIGVVYEKEHAALIVTAVNAHAALLEACKEFVRKCECGEARSVRSYAQMKAAIALAEGEKE